MGERRWRVSDYRETLEAIRAVLEENERLWKEWGEAHAANELLLDTKHVLKEENKRLIHGKNTRERRLREAEARIEAAMTIQEDDMYPDEDRRKDTIKALRGQEVK